MLILCSSGYNSTMTISHNLELCGGFDICILGGAFDIYACYIQYNHCKIVLWWTEYHEHLRDAKTDIGSTLIFQ